MRTPRPNRALPPGAAILLALICAAASAARPAAPEPEPEPAPAVHGARAGQAAGTVEPKPPPSRIPALDTLDQLRERLALKIGATKSTDRKSVLVMQVAAPATNDLRVSATAAPAATGRSPAARHVARSPAGARREAPAAPGAPHWDYGGAAGPQAWGSMNPEFSQCATGRRQSPIDIREGIAVDLEPVAFDYRGDSGFSVVDNGHTVQVNVAPGNAIEVLGRRYELQQFHFHRPSEERIEGRQFDMVAHLVHQDAEGRTAVVAVLLERGSAQPIVQTVWNNLPLEKGEVQTARATLDLQALLPRDRRYYTYMGSLTTPPCTEGVLWMVMAQPVAVSAQQIDIFARLYPMNARPLQDAAGRLIKQSN